MNKPEWFELTEKDGGKTHFEVKRGLKSFVLAIPLLAIGAGVVFAQTSNESPAAAETATVASAAPTVTPSVTQSVAPSVTSAVVPAKPSIATPPTLTGDDYDDEDGDNRNHKRGERNHDDDDEGDDD